MPLVAMNMAQPFNRIDMDYMLPHDMANYKQRNKKYYYIKTSELVFSIIAIVLFTISFENEPIIIRDLLISGIFGCTVAYPLFTILLPLVHSKNTTTALLLFNGICSLFLFVAGFMLFTSWYFIQDMLLSEEFSADTDVSQIKTRATLKFTSTLFVFINGLLYLAEAFIQLLEFLKFI